MRLRRPRETAARTLALAGALAATLATAVAAGAAPAAPRAGLSTVARVNGNPIARRDYDLMVQVRFRQRGPGQRRYEDLQAVRQAVLEGLIDNELLYQKALGAKVTVPDDRVRAEAEKLKTALGTRQEAAAFLRDNGLTDKDLEEETRRSLMVEAFVDKEIAPDVAVTETDARAWYDGHPDSVARPEAVRVRQIVIRSDPEAPPGQRATAREKIEAILKELRAGKDFAEEARLYSDGPESKRGGDSGWIWAGGGALPQVERSALALKPGQRSDIIETRRGFHIIEATEHRPGGPAPFDEVKDGIVERLKKDRRTEKVKPYVAELRRSARIEKTP